MSLGLGLGLGVGVRLPTAPRSRGDAAEELPMPPRRGDGCWLCTLCC